MIYLFKKFLNANFVIKIAGLLAQTAYHMKKEKRVKKELFI